MTREQRPSSSLAMLMPLQVSYLAILFEATFLGIHAAVITAVIWIWRWRNAPTKVHTALYVTLIIMFLISIVHTAVVVARYMLPSTLGKDPRTQQLITALAIIQYFFSDYVIMWRAWVVWNCNYLVMIIPFCISCIAFGFGFSVLPKVALLDVASPTLLSVNYLLCTGLIVGRILYVNTFSQGSRSLVKIIRKSPYRSIIFLLCETGALNAFITTATVVLFQLKSELAIIALDFVVPLMGILPSSIVVLVALNATMPHDEQTVDFTSRLEALGFHHTTCDDSGVTVEP
ncbi:hypothetical protein D9613_002392 [Agrocybe pediades]|uniref:Uncharacterized protein n=1 Tax=Agrocybe pediades TaxID=84607 RepID=A0A8H4R738_9AGAR|nr:hypothetical protein D9613_002392 [Agrocybe pediades]